MGEGALSEVHAMLERLKELAGQLANGVYQDETDREALAPANQLPQGILQLLQ